MENSSFRELFSRQNRYVRAVTSCCLVITLVTIIGIICLLPADALGRDLKEHHDANSLCVSIPPNSWTFTLEPGPGGEAYEVLILYDAFTTYCPEAILSASLSENGSRLTILLDGACDLGDVNAGILAEIEIYEEGAATPSFSFLVKDGGGQVIVVQIEI